jgi:hypothetical protein
VVIFLVIINYRWRSSYQEGSVGIPLICLNPPHICARLKERPGFPTSYVVAFLCSVKRGEMIARFVDIGGSDDHHYLYFPLVVMLYYQV